MRVALRHGLQVTQQGISDSLEERVRQTLKGLHWSGRFCQVRGIQQMQARGGSQLMAEADDGRDGWSARRGGSTIDVTLGWTNDGAFGWSWLGGPRARDQAAILASVRKGPVPLWCSRVGFPAGLHHVSCLVCVSWSLCMCVCVCTCVFACAHTLICNCQCAIDNSTSVELCVFGTLAVHLCVSLCALACAHVCVCMCVHAHP